MANNTTFTSLCSGWVRKKARKLLAEANVVYYNVKAKAAVIVEQKARKKVNPPPLKSAAENGDVEGSSDETVNPPPLKSAAENGGVEGSDEENEDSALALLQDGNVGEPRRMTTRQKEKEVLTEMGILLDEVTENDLQDTEHVLDKIRTGEMKDAFQVSPLYQQGAFG